MKVDSKTTVTTTTHIEVTQEDLINALNSSGDYNIPYNAKIWINCERRDKFDLKEGFIHISFNVMEDIPVLKDEPVPF